MRIFAVWLDLEFKLIPALRGREGGRGKGEGGRGRCITWNYHRVISWKGGREGGREEGFLFELI